MESNEGGTAQAPLPAAGEPTAGGGQPSRGRRRRRRQRRPTPQPQGPPTYAEMAGGSVSPPPAGGPQSTTDEKPQSSAPSASSPTSSQPGPSNQSGRQVGGVGQRISRSESSQNVPPPDGQSVGPVQQQLSRSAKKRRKRQARKNSLRGETQTRHEAVQPSSDPEKGDESTSRMEEPSGSVLSSQQHEKRSESGICTEVPSGSTLSDQDTERPDEVEKRTEVPSSSVSSKHPAQEDERETSTDEHSSRMLSTLDPATRHVGDTCTEGPNGSTSIHQQRSQLSDTRHGYVPGTSTYLSTFPTMEELRQRFRCRVRGCTTRQTQQQGSRRKDTKSQIDSLQEKEGSGALEDNQSVKPGPSKSSSPKLSVPHSEGYAGSDDEDSRAMGSSSSSIELGWVYEDTWRDLKVEFDRQEYIMSMINDCTTTLSSMVGQFTQSIRGIFGNPKIDDRAGPSGVANGSSHVNTGEIDNGYDVTHEQRLEAIKVYMYEIYLEIAALRPAVDAVGESWDSTDLDELYHALLPVTVTPSEPSRQSAQAGPAEHPSYQEPSMWNLTEEAGPSMSSQVEAGPSTSPQVEAGNSTSAQGEQVTQSSNRPDPNDHGETSRSSILQKFDYNILTVALNRVYYMRGSFMTMYDGIVALVNTVNQALEAYRWVQQVVDRVLRPPYAAINGFTSLATDAALTTSDCLQNALCEAEGAVRIHFAFSQALHEFKNLLADLNPNQPSAHEIDRPALLERLVSLLRRSCDVIDFEWLRANESPTETASVVSSSPRDEVAAAGEYERGTSATPLQGFEALLWATQFAFQAVEAAMMPLDVLYVARNVIRENEEDTEDDDD